jgi:hypothetical protein
MWRPVVRFKASDYVFEKDSSTNEPIVLQVNMQSQLGAKRMDFGQPSLPQAAARRATSA